MTVSANAALDGFLKLAQDFDCKSPILSESWIENEPVPEPGKRTRTRVVSYFNSLRPLSVLGDSAVNFLVQGLSQRRRER
jgi:hypothetical protein